MYYIIPKKRNPVVKTARWRVVNNKVLWYGINQTGCVVTDYFPTYQMMANSLTAQQRGELDKNHELFTKHGVTFR